MREKENFLLPTEIKPEIVVTDIAFAEGPTVAADGYIYFVNYKRLGTIGRYFPGGSPEVWAETGGQANGLKYDPRGFIVVADFGGQRITRFSLKTGKMEIITSEYEGSPYLGPNDLCLDTHGDIVFTDPTGSSVDNPIGSIYKIKTAKDGLAQKVIRLDNELAFPNGLAFHPDGSKLYLAESGTNRLLSYSVDEEGLLSDKKIVIQFPTDTLDGISFDQFSNLWIARWTNGTIDVVDISSGSLIKSYKLGERVTNMCWLNGYLYVTIAGNGTIVRIPVWH